MDILAWISMWISTFVWIFENCHTKIMDIHVNIRGFLEIHAWICYGFSDQGSLFLLKFLFSSFGERFGVVCLGPLSFSPKNGV